MITDNGARVGEQYGIHIREYCCRINAWLGDGGLSVEFYTVFVYF